MAHYDLFYFESPGGGQGIKFRPTNTTCHIPPPLPSPPHIDYIPLPSFPSLPSVFTFFLFLLFLKNRRTPNPNPNPNKASRIALSLAGANWTDHRIARDQWPALKTSGRAPFGQMPFVEITEANGDKWALAQGHSIVREVWARFLAGKSDHKANAIADSLVERLVDVKTSFGKHAPYTLPAEERHAKSAEWVAAEWPAISAQLDRFLGVANTGFLVGAHVSVADIVWYTFIKYFFGTLPLSDAQKRFVAHFEAQPAVQAFLHDATKNPAAIAK